MSAVLGLAAMSANAETYSSNVVGYVNVNLVAGWNMIANPLNAQGGDNSFNTILTAVPDGTTAFKFVDGSWSVPNSYSADYGEWDQDWTLNPGEGVFINSPEAATLTFVGEVLYGTQPSVEIPVGWSLVSNPLPIAGTIGNIDFPATDGDTIFVWADGSYSTPNAYDAEYEEWGNMDMSFAVGQGFLVNKTKAGSWVRNFAQ